MQEIITFIEIYVRQNIKLPDQTDILTFLVLIYSSLKPCKKTAHKIVFRHITRARKHLTWFLFHELTKATLCRHDSLSKNILKWWKCSVGIDPCFVRHLYDQIDDKIKINWFLGRAGPHTITSGGNTWWLKNCFNMLRHK